MKNSFLTLFTGCAFVFLVHDLALAAQVTEQEAISIAEWWYAREISAPITTLTALEKQERIAEKGTHQIHYLLGRDNLQGRRHADDSVLAYVVTFEPSGFVVISGEDALQPVLAFNATRAFLWESPEESYLSRFIGRCVARSVQLNRTNALTQASKTHKNWSLLREQIHFNPTNSASTLATSSSSSASEAGTYVMLPTALWGQGDHYNDVCVAHNGGFSLPTGCTATAMAIKFRYHEWPKRGYGSHAYDDSEGNVQYHHSVNFSDHAYDWSAMPTTVLTADNSEVAQLMYDCGVAVEMNYEQGTDGGSGAWPDAASMNKYFRYRGTIEVSASNPSRHIDRMAYSICCGLPVIMSSLAHTVVACGYRESIAPYFFLNAGHDITDNDWYDLDQLAWGNDATIDTSYPYSSPDNYVYVDTSSRVEFGDLQYPFNTVAEGQTNAPSGGVLMLKSGNYTGEYTFKTPLTLNSYLGTATVGH